MIHLRETVPNWLEAVQRLPNGAMVKTIDQGQEFIAVKAINPNINTVLRHYIGNVQPFGGTWEDNVQRARDFFATFIDGTFVNQIAPHCDYVEEWNEYLAVSNTEQEILERLLWAEAACYVWKHDYRIQPELAHIRLIICNCAIGNDIDWRFGRIAYNYDAVLGYHPYTYWITINGQHIRAANDWVDLSGRWERMDIQMRSLGYTVDWAFTECGPFESVEAGWLAPGCLDADVDAYIHAMRQWTQEVTCTHAYQSGRIKGYAIFDTARSGWKHFRTDQPELNMLAEMVAQEWRSYTPPEPPVGEPCRGAPRLQYHRVYNTLSVHVGENDAVAIFLDAMRNNRQTVGFSYDDAGIGDLDHRLARLHGVPASERQTYAEWYAEYYPGATVEFID